MNRPRILGIGMANPLVRLIQEQSFHTAGDQGERIRKIFLNSDIDHRNFYLEGTLNRGDADQLNEGLCVAPCKQVAERFKTV